VFRTSGEPAADALLRGSEVFNTKDTKDTKEEKARFARWKSPTVVGD